MHSLFCDPSLLESKRTYRHSVLAGEFVAFLLFSLLLLANAVSTAQAETYSFNDLSHDHRWNTDANWKHAVAGLTPTGADDVVILKNRIAEIYGMNASANNLTNLGTLRVMAAAGAAYTLDVQGDLVNHGTLQVKGYAGDTQGTAFYNISSIPGYYDQISYGFDYQPARAALYLNGSAASLTSLGTIQTQNGGFFGNNVQYDPISDLYSSSSATVDVDNQRYTNSSGNTYTGRISADGGTVYHAQTRDDIYFNVNEAIYGFVAESEHTESQAWLASVVQLYGGDAGTGLFQNSGSIQATRGGIVNLMAYSAFNNSGTISSEGTGKLFTDTDVSGVNLYSDGSLQGYNFSSKTLPASAIVINGNYISGSQFENSGTIQAIRGGIVSIQNYDMFNNDGVIVSDGTGLANGSHLAYNGSTIYGSNIGVFVNNTNIYAHNGGSVQISAGTVSNFGNVSVDGMSHYYDSQLVRNPSQISLLADSDFLNTGDGYAVNGGSLTFGTYSGSLMNQGSIVASGVMTYPHPGDGSTSFLSSHVTLDSGFGSFTNDEGGQIIADSGGVVTVLSNGGANNLLNLGSILATGGYMLPDKSLISSEVSFVTHGSADLLNYGSIKADNGGYITADLANLGNAGDIISQGIYTDPYGKSTGSAVYISTLGQVVNAGGGQIAALNGGSIQINALDSVLNSDNSIIAAVGGSSQPGSDPIASSVQIQTSYLTNEGAIGAIGGASVDITATQSIFNTGQISASGPVVDGFTRSTVSMTADTITNAGLMAAYEGGSLYFTHNDMTNVGTLFVAAGGLVSITSMNSSPCMVQQGADAVTYVDGVLQLRTLDTAASAHSGTLVLDGSHGADPGAGGLVTGEGYIDGNVVNVDGVIKPGDETDSSLQILGDYTQEAGGKLYFTALNPYQLTMLNVGGNLDLSGELFFDFSQIDSALVKTGMQWDFLTWGGDFTYGNHLRLKSNLGEDLIIRFDPNRYQTLELMVVPETNTLFGFLIGVLIFGVLIVRNRAVSHRRRSMNL